MGGHFIVLEGIDGAGTTTQTELLAEHLRRRGRPVHTTREPSTGPVGRLIREILMGQHRLPDGRPMEGGTMALLFAADRRDHLVREIEPALKAGAIVISDRYLPSSLAYQAEESERDWVRTLARGIRVPDLTFLLEVTVAEAAQRRLRAGRPVERYDDGAFQERVATQYRRLAQEDPSMRVVDGSGSVEAVAARVAALVDEVLP